MLWFDICSGKHLARSRLVDDFLSRLALPTASGAAPHLTLISFVLAT